jgi:large subunit ribosomal protein L19
VGNTIDPMKTKALAALTSAEKPRDYKEWIMNLIAQIEAEQIAELGKDIPDFKAGDTVRVGFRVTEGTRTRVQNYEGVCIARKNGKGIAGSFTVRKISFGEGVERVFPLYSTNIDSITVVRRGRVRRAKLYYLRERRGKSARIVEKTNYRAPKSAAQA